MNRLPVASPAPHYLSRRHVIAGLSAALVAAPACRAPAQREAVAAVPLSRFGIDSFSSRDQWTQLKQAFAAANAEGFPLVADPDAHYRHDGPLTLDGVSFDGHGCTLSALSDGPQVLRCIGSNWRVANLRLLGASRTRNADNWGNGIWVGDEDGQSATDFTLENVTVDAVAADRGVAGAGFMFNDAHRGRIVNAVVRHSLADGIHVTNGSSELAFERPLSEATGDDGFAVVSYRRHARLCSAIRVTDGISRDSAARGFSVVGGRDVRYERVRVERSSAAGVYLYGEAPFDTYGVTRCQVLEPVLRYCCTGHGLPAGFANAAIIIGGREGEDRIDGEVLTRGASDCLIRNPSVEGAGSACTAAISIHQFALRPRITGARLRNIVATGGDLRANGIEVGGRDVVVEKPVMNGIAGIAILVARTASGRCTISAPRVVGSHLRPGPINSFIYAEPAPDLRRIDVRDGVFARGPARLAISLLPAGTLQLAANRVE